MNKTLIIRVFPNGQTEITTQGFTGAGCRDASAELEKTLGQKLHEQFTAEFYESQEQTGIRQREG